MSPNSELNSLSFLFRHTDLDDEEQQQCELEKADVKNVLEKNDLPAREKAQDSREAGLLDNAPCAGSTESPRRHDPCSDRPNET